MIRYDHYTDKFVKVSDRECPWCKAVCASTDKYCHECGWHIADTPQTDIPKSTLRTDCTGCKFVGSYDTEFPCANCVRKNKDYYDAEQTESTGSPIGDYRDGVGAWQTDCKTCKHYKLACELFSEVCKYEPTTQTETKNSNLTFDISQTDCGWK